jgi:hypothetical protein
MIFQGRVARAVWVGVCALIAGAAGCASVLGIDADRHVGESDAATLDEVTLDAGTNAEAGPYANVPPNWQCLNNAPPGKDAGPVVQVQFQFESASGNSSTVQGNQGTPVPGVSVHACNTLDVGCLSPITSNSISDDAGMATVKVPEAFTGYYELKAPNFLNSILARPAQYHSEYQLQGLAPASLVAVGGDFVGIKQDPNSGFVVISALDCGPVPAAGVTFTIEGNVGPNEQVIYLANNLPTTGATQTDSVSGAALVFNVPVVQSDDAGGSTAATLTLRASFASTGQEIKTVSALVRASQQWMTYVDIRPDQSAWAPPITED